MNIFKKIGKGIKNVAKGVGKGVKGVAKATVKVVKVTGKGIKKAAPFIAAGAVAFVATGGVGAVAAIGKKGASAAKKKIKEKADEKLRQQIGIDTSGKIATTADVTTAKKAKLGISRTALKDAVTNHRRAANVSTAKTISDPITNGDTGSVLKSHTYEASKSPSSPRSIKPGREPRVPEIVESAPAPAADAAAPGYQMAGMSPAMLIGLAALGALALRKK